MTDNSYGFVSFGDAGWKLDEEAWKKHCAGIANAGGNAKRILPYGVWDARPYGRRSQFSPWFFDEAIHRWDLGKFNGYYFPIMRRIFEIANSYNMTVWFPWFDQCQMFNGYWSGMVPWKQNVNGITSFYSDKADLYATTWVKRVLAEYGDLDMFWPWGNELDQNPFPAWARRVLFPIIRDKGIPLGKMTYGATLEECTYLGNGQFNDKPPTQQDIVRKFLGEDFPPEKNKMKLIREVHGCGRKALDSICKYGHRVHQAANWWGNKPVGKWLVSDDGTKDQPNPVDGGRPTAARWHDMALWHFERFDNVAGFEHLPESRNLDYQITVMGAISKAYKERYGSWPENYGKHHYEPPTPGPGPNPEPPTPSPNPPPEPPEPGKSFWQRFREWLKRIFG
jgi:hypothetical protein